MLSTIPGNPAPTAATSGCCFRNSSIAASNRGQKRIVAGIVVGPERRKARDNFPIRPPRRASRSCRRNRSRSLLCSFHRPGLTIQISDDAQTLPGSNADARRRSPAVARRSIARSHQSRRSARLPSAERFRADLRQNFLHQPTITENRAGHHRAFGRPADRAPRLGETQLRATAPFACKDKWSSLRGRERSRPRCRSAPPKRHRTSPPCQNPPPPPGIRKALRPPPRSPVGRRRLKPAPDNRRRRPSSHFALTNKVGIFPAARRISAFFFGTTEETTTCSTSRFRRNFAIAASLRRAVSIRSVAPSFFRRSEGQLGERIADVDQQVTALLVRRGPWHNERNKHRATPLHNRGTACPAPNHARSLGREKIGSPAPPPPAHRSPAQPRARDQSQSARFHPSAFRERENQRPPRRSAACRASSSLRLTKSRPRPRALPRPVCRPFFSSASLTKRTSRLPAPTRKMASCSRRFARSRHECPELARHDRRLPLRIHEPRPLRRDADRRRPFPCPERRERRIARENRALPCRGRRRHRRAERHDGRPHRRDPRSARRGWLRPDRDHELRGKIRLRLLRSISRSGGKPAAIWRSAQLSDGSGQCH